MPLLQTPTMPDVPEGDPPPPPPSRSLASRTRRISGILSAAMTPGSPHPAPAMPQTQDGEPQQPTRGPRSRRISGLLSATGLLSPGRGGAEERERRRSTGSYGLNRPPRPSRRSVIVPPLLSELEVVSVLRFVINLQWGIKQYSMY